MPGAPAILFTAFETSGDAIAAPLIAELKRREPERPIYALGGECMAAAGATIIEDRTDNAVMMLGATRHAWEHHKRLRRLRQWLSQHPLAALVPTDSPAANWSICKLVRQVQPDARIVHLVAPQLWAWAPWRIRKMRRLSDHVMCLLPFEPEWFNSRGMPATLVGHPLFTPDAPPPAEGAADLDLPTDGHPKLALLPGSRASEIKANWPTMLEALRRLRPAYPNMRVVIAASSPGRAKLVRALSPGGSVPHRAVMVTGQASAALDWADAAVVVSGTATLHAASRRTPMVVLFNVNRWSWTLAGRWLVQTRTFSLPNLISESLGLGRVVPELVPHFGEVEPVLDALKPLLADDAERARQREGFETIARCYAQIPFATSAADTLLGQINAPRSAAAPAEREAPVQ